MSGQYNARLSTTNWRNLIVGQSNYRNASSIQYSTASGYSNNINNTSAAWFSALFGRENLEDAENLQYTFASGYQNGRTLTSASFSFFNGYRNAYN